MSGAQRLRGGQQRSWADGVAEHDSHSLKAVGRFFCTFCTFLAPYFLLLSVTHDSGSQGKGIMERQGICLVDTTIENATAIWWSKGGVTRCQTYFKG